MGYHRKKNPKALTQVDLCQVSDHGFEEPRRNKGINIMNDKLYTYRVSWSEEDEEFVGLCAEFPGMS
jgi:hypothetical protein